MTWWWCCRTGTISLSEALPGELVRELVWWSGVAGRGGARYYDARNLKQKRRAAFLGDLTRLRQACHLALPPSL